MRPVARIGPVRAGLPCRVPPAGWLLMEQMQVPEVEPAVTEDARPWAVRFDGGEWRRAGSVAAVLVLIQVELEQEPRKLAIEVERKVEGERTQR